LFTQKVCLKILKVVILRLIINYLTMKFIPILSFIILLAACKSNQSDFNNDLIIQKTEVASEAEDESNFEHISEQFADLRVLRYFIPSFNELSL